MSGTAVAGGSGRLDSKWMQWGLAALVVGVVADVLFNIDVKKGENGGTGPLIVVAVGLVVLTVVLYGFVFPRFANAPKAALITGIVSFVLLAAFWSAGSVLVGFAAFGYGLADRTDTRARIGMALAGIAIAVDVVAAIMSA